MNLYLKVLGGFTVPISERLSLRVYADTRPLNWKIADLQKGLILMLRSNELVGEGAGFGVPIIKNSKNTFFSGTSRVSVSQQSSTVCIRKEFSIDRVSRETFGNTRLENREARVLIDHLSKLYQRHRHLRFLSLKDLVSRFGVHARFVSVPSVGTVTASYVLKDRKISVKVDFRSIIVDRVESLFVLNEQSSTCFGAYQDSNGSELFDGDIGAWDEVAAEWASMSELQGKIGFRLRRVPNSTLRRGREFLRDSMDWVGLDYELAPSTRVFEYEIDILGD